MISKGLSECVFRKRGGIEMNGIETMKAKSCAVHLHSIINICLISSNIHELRSSIGDYVVR